MPTSSKAVCEQSSFDSIVSTPTKFVCNESSFDTNISSSNKLIPSDKYKSSFGPRIPTSTRLTVSLSPFNSRMTTSNRSSSLLLDKFQTTPIISATTNPNRISMKIKEGGGFLLTPSQYCTKSNAFTLQSSTFIDQDSHFSCAQSQLFKDQFMCNQKNYLQQDKDGHKPKVNRKKSDLLNSMNSFQCDSSFTTERGMDFDSSSSYVEYDENGEFNDLIKSPRLPTDSSYREERENRRFQNNLPAMNDYSMPGLTFFSPQCNFVSDQKDVTNKDKFTCNSFINIFDEFTPKDTSSLYENKEEQNIGGQICFELLYLLSI